MTKIYPLTDSFPEHDWDTDRWEDDGGRSLSTANDFRRYWKIDDLIG